MVDGNGLLHPRGKSVFYSIKCPYQLSRSLYFEVFPWPGFGLASHLGVIANIPTIGVGKNVSLHQLLFYAPLHIISHFNEQIYLQIYKCIFGHGQYIYIFFSCIMLMVLLNLG